VSRDPEVVRGRILDAAQAQFMAAGFEAASTNRIVAAFGGSKATVFRYYPTKERLLEGVLLRIADRWLSAVDLRALPVGQPEQWLTGCASQMLGWILGPEPLFVGRLAIAEGHKFPELGKVFEERAIGPLRVSLAARLGAWHREGLLISVSPEHDAEHFLDLTFAGEVSRALYGRPARSSRALTRHVHDCVRIFLRGLRGLRGLRSQDC
jgi:TetR/AcrR family transcriptional regulator, mexJK operon transcriptional repressor